MRSPQDELSPGEASHGTPLDEPLAEFLDRKAKTVDEKDGDRVRSGNYVQALQRIIPKWIDAMERNGVETLEALDGRRVAQYADGLSRRVGVYQRTDGTKGISPATAWHYYSLVSAYLNYCQQWEYLAENPADTAVAKEPMPDRPKTNAGQQQFWSAEQRHAIVSYVENRAYEAIDDDPSSAGALTAARDRAFVYMIGFSGVRGAEILAATRDDRRTGITWGDVDTDEEVLTVYGKSQQVEQAPLTNKPVATLDRWETLVDPPTTKWPVFPSFHPASLRDAARDQLTERGVDDETIDEVTGLGTAGLLAAFREHELVPPALTTEGGRYLMRKYSDAADIDCSNSPKSYLTLHGARRGAGEVYYEAGGAQAAQRALRHEDPSTTSEMYAHKEASELSEIGNEAFEKE